MSNSYLFTDPEEIEACGGDDNEDTEDEGYPKNCIICPNEKCSFSGIDSIVYCDDECEARQNNHEDIF